MAVTTAQVQQAYVAFFNRPADLAGLNYWTSSPAASVANLLDAFSKTPEYTSLYSNMNSTQLVNAVYQNLFGRAVESVDALNYWVGLLDKGTVTLGSIAATVADLAITNKTADGTLVSNKVAAATAFTTSLSTASNAAAATAYATANSTGLQAVKNWLAAVTSDASTLTNATSTTTLDSLLSTVKNNVASTGSTFTLTVGLDALTGTAGNDTFVGTLDAVSGKGTINVGDSVDGGAGTDTFKLVSNVTSGNNNTGLTLNNIEKVEIANLVNGTSNAHTFNAAAVTGVQEIAVTSAGDVTVSNIGTAALAARGFVSNNSAAQLVTAAGANTLNLGGVSVGTAASSALNIDISGGAAGAAQAVVVNSTGAANTISDLKIGNTTDGASSLTINAATNFKTSTVTEFVANKLATITASGAATTVDVGTVSSNVLKSVDASGLTAGGMKIGIGGNLATTFKGGAGTDTVTIKAGAVITGAIDGGAGTDIVAVSDTFAGGSTAQNDTSLTTATGKLITGFETLRVSATSSGGTVGTTDIVTFDPTLVAGITSYEVGTSTYGVALKNLVANAAVKIVGNVSAAGGLTLLQKDATGTADAATLTFDNGNTLTTGNNNGLTVATLTVGNGTDSIETLNVVSKGLITGSGTANTITTLATATGTAPSKVVITGDQAFTMATGATANTITVDGSGATGALTITSAATGKVNINGGSANDTITLSAAALKGGLVYGGAGGDAIDLGSSHNGQTLVYKAASDSLIDTSADATKVKMDTVSNFTTTKDTIDVSSFGFTAAQKGAVVYDATTYASLAKVMDAANANAATWYNDASATARAVKVVTDGSHDYIFVDANKDGQFNASSDVVIKLAGLTAADASKVALADFAF